MRLSSLPVVSPDGQWDGTVSQKIYESEHNIESISISTETNSRGQLNLGYLLLLMGISFV